MEEKLQLHVPKSPPMLQMAFYETQKEKEKGKKKPINKNKTLILPSAINHINHVTLIISSNFIQFN